MWYYIALFLAVVYLDWSAHKKMKAVLASNTIMGALIMESLKKQGMSEGDINKLVVEESKKAFEFMKG